MIQGTRRGSGPAAGPMLSWLVSSWLVLLLVGCGPMPPATPRDLDDPLPGLGSGACPLGPPVPHAGGEIRVGLTEPVDWSHAPVPTNDAERFLFRQCYETLVKLDCKGRLVPGLARRWESDPDGRTWIFTIAWGRRFWDGDEADAHAVGRALRRVHDRDGDLPPELRWIDPESVISLDEQRLRITLTDLGMAVGSAHVFAHPALAVASYHGPRIICSGTGRLVAEPGERADVTVLWPRPPDPLPDDMRRPPRPRPSPPSPPSPPRGPFVTVVAHPGVDARDLLAEGFDLVIARSEAFADYAHRLPDVEVMDLPWDRIYVLLAPVAGPAPAERAAVHDSNLLMLREDLAGRGSSADAQPAYGLSFDVSRSGACGDAEVDALRLDQAAGSVTRARIVYPAGDRDAGLMAERVAGLAIMKSDLLFLSVPGSHLAGAASPPRTEPLSPAAWREAVRGEDSFAYVLPLRREPFGRCGLRTMLRQQAPWVVIGPDDHGPNMVPLVVTRPVLVVRRGLGGLRIDGNGTPLLYGAGWLPEELWP